MFVGHNVTFINDRHPSADAARTGAWCEGRRRRVSIGSSAVIMCGVTIGAGARIGTGAVILDVPAGASPCAGARVGLNDTMANIPLVNLQRQYSSSPRT